MTLRRSVGCILIIVLVHDILSFDNSVDDEVYWLHDVIFSEFTSREEKRLAVRRPLLQLTMEYKKNK